MKTPKEKFVGLQQKIFLFFVVNLLITIAAYTLVASLGTKKLGKTINQTNDELQETIGSISTETMESVARDTLMRNAAKEARMIDDIFGEVITDVEILQTLTEDVFANKNIYVPRQFAAENTKSNIHLYYEKGTDPNTSDYLKSISYMTESLQSFCANTDIMDACYIGTADGMFVIANDGSELPEADEGLYFPTRQRPWYKGAEETGKLYLTKIESDPIKGVPEITFSAPIYSDNKLAAVVGADIFLDSIEETVNSSTENGGFLCIINDEGKILFSPMEEGTFGLDNGDKDLRADDNPQLSEFIKKALEENTDIHTITVDNTEYYIAGAPLKTCNWTVVTAVPVSVVMSPANELLDKYNTIVQKSDKTTAENIKNSVGFIVLATGMVFLIAVIGSISLARRLVKPIKTMSERIEGMKEDDIQFFMEDCYRTNDEVEILAKAFASLSEKTVNYIAQVTRITAEKERISAELDVATQIQADMLPRIFPPYPEKTEFDIYAGMQPAKEVGGDFYDFFLIDDDRLALVIADVSGKGVPAALFMVIAKTLIKNRAQMGGSPSEILHDVNTQLCEGNEAEMFVTVWLAIINFKTGEGTASNAGHEYPAVCRNGEKFELIKNRHSPAVATFDGIKFRENEFKLAPGDTLFVYTDGVPEAVNENNEMFGTERMIDVLNAGKTAELKELLENMKKSIEDFAGDTEQFDDMTMLAIRYYGVK